VSLLSQLLDSKGRAVHSIAPGASVIDAIRSMANNHVGALLVLEGQQLVGIVSERDYARKVILLGRSSNTTAVREIMSAPVHTLPPDSTVNEAMRVMTERRIRHLPVVQLGKVLGVVSIGDLVKNLLEEQQHTIEDLRSYIRG
jgi:CBS domain-containing protein